MVVLRSEQVAIIDAPHDDELLLHHLLVHVRQELLLLLDEILHRFHVELLAVALVLAEAAQLGAHALLEDLETVLAVLGVQLREVGDGADGGEDGVVGEVGAAGAEGGHHRDALGGPEGTQGLVFDVAALQDDGAAHLRAAHLDDLAVARLQRRLAANHVGAITEHSHADERVGVGVPVDDGLVVFPRASGDTFVFVESFLLHESLHFFLSLLVRFDGDVDVGNLEVHLCDELHAGNLRDDGQRFGVLPGVIDKRRVPGIEVSFRVFINELREGILTWQQSHGADIGPSCWNTGSYPRHPC